MADAVEFVSEDPSLAKRVRKMQDRSIGNYLFWPLQQVNDITGHNPYMMA